MLQSNFEILANRGLGRRDVSRLVRIIEGRPGIMKLDGIRTSYLSSGEVKLTALIRYNPYYLSRLLLHDMQSDIKSRDFTVDEAKRVETLICKQVELTLTHTTEVKEDMERDIRLAFPHVKYIDLEYVLSKDKRDVKEN